MSEPSLVLYHAFLLLAHGGELSDDCDLCEQLSLVAKATEAAISGSVS